MTRLGIFFLLPLGLAGAACGASQSSGPPLQTITITETDSWLSPSTITLNRPGLYAFHAVNQGQTKHSLDVEGNGVDRDMDQDLGSGQSDTLMVNLARPGTYQIFSQVSGDKAKGLSGQILVKG